MDAEKVAQNRFCGGGGAHRTGLAAELWFAAELLRRGWDVSFPFPGAAGVDLYATCEAAPRSVAVQVKGLLRPNRFCLDRESVVVSRVYAFVLLGSVGLRPEVAIACGLELSKYGDSLWTGGTGGSPQGISWSRLHPWRGKWGELLG